MTQRAALAELLACVEAGRFPVEYGILVHAAVGAYYPLFWKAYDDDMAAAIELVEYLLPGARWSLVRNDVNFATIVSITNKFHSATHPTRPIRTLLLAVFKAKLATMGEGE